jgi:hypothetical protein
VVGSQGQDFRPPDLLDTGGAAVEVNSGSAGSQCGWIALRDSGGRGVFAG